MNTTNLLYKLFTYPGNSKGFYTKKQCIQMATDIGCELVDMCKSGENITKDAVSKTIKKYAPSADIKIVTNGDEYIAAGVEKGYSKESMEEAFQNLDKNKILACYSNMIDGIYLPLGIIKYPEELNFVAHEIKHYLYDKTTPLRRFQHFIRARIEKFISKQEASATQNSLSETENISVIKQATHINTDKTKDVAQRLANDDIIHGIETDLQNLFGLVERGYIPILSETSNSFEVIKNFYKNPKIFAGLTNDKRIDAYIRTILRHYINPKNPDSIPLLTALQALLKDEVGAYTVSENVITYAARPNKKTTTIVKVIPDIYARAVKLIDNEIKTAIIWEGKREDMKKAGLPIKIYKTGLPTNSFKQL